MSIRLAVLGLSTCCAAGLGCVSPGSSDVVAEGDGAAQESRFEDVPASDGAAEDDSDAMETDADVDAADADAPVHADTTDASDDDGSLPDAPADETEVIVDAGADEVYEDAVEEGDGDGADVALDVDDEAEGAGDEDGGDADPDACVPTGAELCDDRDNDCDGLTDEDAGCVCRTGPDCDDGNPCTEDRCSAERHCESSGRPDGTPCPGGLCCGTACVDPATDATHCGGCGRSCGSSAACAGGGCYCLYPGLDCDASWASGCEVDPTTNPLHCGGCGVYCDGADQACAGSACGCARPAGVWAGIDVVDAVGVVGRDASLAHDSAGNLHAAYYDAAGLDLRHARHGPDGFWKETVPATSFPESITAAVDPAGLPHLLYYRSGRGPVHEWRDGTGWNAEDVPFDAGTSRQELTIDRTGILHVAYESGDGVRYARRTSTGTWSDEPVDPGPWALDPGIAVDDAGGVHVAYYRQSGGEWRRAYAYRGADGIWSLETIAVPPSWPTVRSGPALAVFGPAGGVRVDLLFALDHYRRSPGSTTWTSERLEPFEQAVSDLAVGPDGTLHAAYCTGSSGDVLRHASRPVGGAWSAEIVAPGSPIAFCPSRMVAIAVDSADGLHVHAPASRGGSSPWGIAPAYFYRPAGGSWQNETLFGPALTTDAVPAELPAVVAVFDATQVYVVSEGRLRSKRVGDLWHRGVVDGAGDVGRYSSMTVTPDDVVHIAYFDASNADLKHAQSSPAGSWTSETVDSEGDVGRHTAAAAASDGSLHVSYYDATHQALRHAVRSPAGGWAVRTIEDLPDADVGRKSAIATGPGHDVHITYADVTNDVLHYARFDGVAGTWTIETLSCGCPGDGGESAVAVDHSGGVHVVFGRGGGAGEWYRPTPSSAWSSMAAWGGATSSCPFPADESDRANRRTLLVDAADGLHFVEPAVSYSGSGVFYGTRAAGAAFWTTTAADLDFAPFGAPASLGPATTDFLAAECCYSDWDCELYGSFLVHLRSCR